MTVAPGDIVIVVHAFKRGPDVQGSDEAFHVFSSHAKAQEWVDTNKDDYHFYIVSDRAVDVPERYEQRAQ